jgi:hypothetical protein
MQSPANVVRRADGTPLDDTTEHLTTLTSRSENVCMVGGRARSVSF